MLKSIGAIVDNCEAAGFRDYEIVAVNDGSNDDTSSVLAEMRDNPKYKCLLVVNQENRGVSAARNTGIEAASGEWIWFVDADDYIADGSVGRFVSIMYGGGKNTNLDCVIFGFSIDKCEGNSDKIYPLFAAQAQHGDIEYVDRDVIDDIYVRNIAGYSQDNLDRLYKGLPISDKPIFLLGTVWHYLFKKAIIKKHGLVFDTKVALNEDGLFVLEYLSCISRAVLVNTIGYRYRLNSTGGLFGTLSNVPKLINNKMAIANGRERARENILRRSGKDIRPYYIASIVLSCMEIAVKSTSRGFKYKEMKQFMAYCTMPVATCAIKSISIKGATLKYRIPFLLLKTGLYRTLFVLLWLVQKLGCQIVGGKSIFK